MPLYRLFTIAFLLLIADIVGRTRSAAESELICDQLVSVQQFQLQQWEKMYSELNMTGSLLQTRKDSQSIGRFYVFPWEVYLKQIPDDDSTSSKSVLYFSIWKAANNLIRERLSMFVNPEKTVSYVRGLKFGDHVRGKQMKGRDFSDSSKYFAFTFIKDPIKRFVSGFSEIEQRSNRKAWIPGGGNIWHPLRIQNFITYVIFDNQMKFGQFDKYLHVSPISGIFQVARQKFNTQLHLYRIENLTSEWQRLYADSGISRFNKFPLHHRESEFQMMTRHDLKSKVKNITTNSAKRFLNTAYSDFHNGNHSSMYVLYFRAKCRMFLSDFLCTGYNLPKICSDMSQATSISHFNA